MKNDKNSRPVVLICDPLDPEGKEILQRGGNLEVVDLKEKSPEMLKKSIRNAQAVVVRSATKITAEILAEAGKLRIIGRAGVGIDNVDVQEASKKGIVVVNTPGGNTISAAEHAISLMLALSRNIVPAHQSMKEGRWDRKKFMGVELFEKTLGLIGLGRIGTEMAKRAQSFGMRVLACDPFLRSEQAQKIGVSLVSLDEVLKESDFISLHVPKNAETKGMIGAKNIEKMKKGVRIINCARGGLIDDAALMSALQSGHVAGAAMDVFEKEPPEPSELFGHPKVIVTPHLGASTEEAQIKVSVDLAKTLSDFFQDKGVRNAVNLPALDPEVLKQMQPYLDLAEKIGSMHGQLAGGQIQRVKIRYDGAASQYPPTALTISVVKGLLGAIMAENVNFVNACPLAKERGIEITQSSSIDPGSFTNLIHVDLQTDKERRTIAATIYNRDDARIVMIDDLRVELQAKGPILYIANNDVPGIVGKIGTALGKEKINIADMTLGRDKKDGRARTLISLDEPITKEVLEKLQSIEHVIDSKLIQL